MPHLIAISLLSLTLFLYSSPALAQPMNEALSAYTDDQVNADFDQLVARAKQGDSSHSISLVLCIVTAMAYPKY